MSFTVRTVRETGTITYHCATPGFALQKVQDFRQAEYQDITVSDGADRVVSESALLILAKPAQLLVAVQA